MKRTPIGYRQALEWLAMNDDCSWVHDRDQPSVAASLVADIYGRADKEVTLDLRLVMISQASGRRTG